MSRTRLIALALAAVLLIPACGGDDDPASPPSTANIDDYLKDLPEWDEFSPQLTDVNDPETEVTGPTEATLDSSGDEIYVCRTTPCSIANTPEAIVTMDPNSEILYLGALIQGRTYKNGLAGMAELPIRQRAPLVISTDLLIPDNTRTVENPTLATVTQAVGEMISGAHESDFPDGSVLSWNMQECHSLEQSMLDIGMSLSYMGASVRTDLRLEQAVETHTIMATFRERMFTTSVVLPQTPSEFFSDAFTQEILDEQIALDRIGPDNLPVFVSNIVWGRIMIFTMTSTYSRSEMEAAIGASYQGIVSGSVDAQYLNVINDEETTVKMVAVGGEASHALEAIRTGSLDEYFASEAAITSAEPLSFTLRRLADSDPALVSETTEYDMVECSTEIVVYHDDFDLWRNAVLDLPGGEVQTQYTTADEIVDSSEISSPPGYNQWMGGTLTFPATSTGLDLDFVLVSEGYDAWVYNDDEFSSGLYPLLSPGDADNGENDDFSVTITNPASPREVLAVGTLVGHNGVGPGENLRVYGEGNLLLAEFTEGLPYSEGWTFMGVISAVPITRIYYDEDSGGDDLVVRDTYFGLTGE